MSITINTNIASLTAQRNLSKSTEEVGKTFESLSSGARVNSSKDDAAGLSISTRMEAQIRGNNQSIRNINDAISLVQTAEGHYDSMSRNVHRIRELAVQAANDTYTTQDRIDMQSEVTALMDDLVNYHNQPKFNGSKLFHNDYDTASGDPEFIIQAGANKDNNLTVQVSDFNPGIGEAVYIWETERGVSQALLNFLAGFGIELGFDSTNVLTQQDAENAISEMDFALDWVLSSRASLGAMQNRLTANIANLENMTLQTELAHSRIIDADVATETANLTKSNIIQQASTAILAQANQQPSIVMQLLR